jgi:hypothetical protein
VGTASVVIGVIAVLVAWVPVWTFVVVLLGPVAIVFALVELLRKGAQRTSMRCRSRTRRAWP